jgi:hypothetical protein
MEQFDAAVFDVIMSFLNPEDACCMACVSTALRSLVEESLRWKEWCERACPSLKSSPAKELLSAHFSRAADAAGPGYRRLYIKLATKRRPGCSKPFLDDSMMSFGWQGTSVMLPRLEGFLMLMDIYNLEGECIISCSANAEVLSDVEKGAMFLDPRPDPHEEFSWSMFLDSQTLINESKQSEATLEKFAVRYGYCPSDEGDSIIGLSLSLRFIRKSDMVLLDVLNQAARVVLVTSSRHPNKDGDMDFRLYTYNESPSNWLLAMKASEAFPGWKTREVLKWSQLSCVGQIKEGLQG